MSAPLRPEDPDRPHWRRQWRSESEDDRFHAQTTRRIEVAMLGFFLLFVAWIAARLLQAHLEGRFP